MVRQQQLTTLDFVSYCGGSLGLFLGFSMLSAIEVIFYMTLRVICVKCQQQRVSPSETNTVATSRKNYLKEYIENSSIHGFNQIVMRRRHFIERFEQCSL
jgi:hypothetical protein